MHEIMYVAGKDNSLVFVDRAVHVVHSDGRVRGEVVREPSASVEKEERHVQRESDQARVRGENGTGGGGWRIVHGSASSPRACAGPRTRWSTRRTSTYPIRVHQGTHLSLLSLSFSLILSPRQFDSSYSPELVEDHQAVRRGIVQDGARLRELHHERALVREDVVARADPREDPIRGRQAAPFRRHEAANLHTNSAYA